MAEPVRSKEQIDCGNRLIVPKKNYTYVDLNDSTFKLTAGNLDQNAMNKRCGAGRIAVHEKDTIAPVLNLISTDGTSQFELSIWRCECQDKNQ